MKRIFYSNITYGCNSNCTFCYSHNTKHNGRSYNEIPLTSLLEYWNHNKLSKTDRVIINGGEPMLHSEIQDILEALEPYECEVLVYSNGRLLPQLNIENFNENYRFIIPIHGYERLHNKITKIDGSYKETIKGLNYLVSGNCKVDIKIIMNYEMISKEEQFKRTLDSLENIPFNNAVHITKMADTIISTRNNCKSVSQDLSYIYTKKLYDFYCEKCDIKIFDTCVRALLVDENIHVQPFNDNIYVYFKDINQESEVVLEKPYMECMKKCPVSELCQSAVGEYKVLEFKKNKIYIGLE